jgi:hypothetical protein
VEDIDRFKAYSAMTEASRKWVSVIDTKAGFLSGLCAATLAFVWTGAKLADAQGCVRYLALSATVMLLTSLFLALKVVLPRVSLRHAFGRDLTYTNGHQPISFFTYVADNFPADKHAKFVALVDAMDEKALAREALEQHYTICHVLQRKSRGVAWAGWIWLLASSLVVGALVLKG